MNIFSKITVGDSASWLEAPFVDTSSGAVYDSSAYALTMEVRGPGATPITLAGVASGPGWKMTLSAVDSAKLVAGTWYWAAYVTKAGERHTVGSGTFAALADLAGVSGAYDGRSQAEKDLAAVKAEISARASGGMTIEYTIGNRSLKKEPIAELLVLRQRLETDVRREREAEAIANGLGNPRRVRVRFS